MKKTRKQRRYEEKHWKTWTVSSLPYHIKSRNHKWPIRGKRFKMDRFVKTVNHMIHQYKTEPFFGGLIGMQQGGVSIGFPNKIIRIICSYN